MSVLASVCIVTWADMIIKHGEAKSRYMSKEENFRRLNWRLQTKNFKPDSLDCPILIGVIFHKEFKRDIYILWGFIQHRGGSR